MWQPSEVYVAIVSFYKFLPWLKSGNLVQIIWHVYLYNLFDDFALVETWQANVIYLAIVPS